MKTKKYFYLILCFCICIYLYISLNAYNKIPLRKDEIISLLAIQSDFKYNIFPVLPSGNYYKIYLLHSLFGKILFHILNDSEFTLRFISIFFHCLSAVMIFLIILEFDKCPSKINNHSLLRNNSESDELTDFAKPLKKYIFAIVCSALFLFDILFFYLSIDGRIYDLTIFFLLLLYFLNLKYNFNFFYFNSVYLLLGGCLVNPVIFFFLFSFIISNFFTPLKNKKKIFLFILIFIIIFPVFLFFLSNQKESIPLLFDYVVSHIIQFKNFFYYIKYFIIDYPHYILFLIIILFFFKIKISFVKFLILFLPYFILSFTTFKYSRLLYIIAPFLLLFIMHSIYNNKKKYFLFIFILIAAFTNYIRYSSDYKFFFDPFRIDFSKFKKFQNNNYEFLTTDPIFIYYYKKTDKITVYRSSVSKDLLFEKNDSKDYYTASRIITGSENFYNFFNSKKNFIFFALENQFYNENFVSSEIRQFICKNMLFLAEYSSPKYFIFQKKIF